MTYNHIRNRKSSGAKELYVGENKGLISPNDLQFAMHRVERGDSGKLDEVLLNKMTNIMRTTVLKSDYLKKNIDQ